MDFSSNHSYILWIHGKRETSKSCFLIEYVMLKKNFTSIYVNIEIKNISSGAYLKAFISQLNKAANLKFTNYFRANYKSMATIGQKVVNAILNMTDTDLDDIDLDKVKNTVVVTKKYIFEALKMRKSGITS